MLDPDELYYTSERYNDLIDKLGDEIEAEGITDRAGNCIDACEHGSKVWACLLELMKILEAKSIYDLDNNGVTIYDLPYWATCFADQLSNACVKDNSYLQKKLRFSKHYVEMHEDFSDKNLLNLGNVRSALAETYYQLGEKDKADSLYEKWLKDEPDWGWGWIAWSDCYWLWRHIGLEQDFVKAEQILRKGLSVKKVSDKEHIEERLKDLLSEKNKLYRKMRSGLDL
jgi:tetratricopeptide (TPR) repeat protein